MQTQAQQSLQKLLKLIRIEQKAHYSAFNAAVVQASLSRRQTQGLSWYPVKIIKKGYGLGDHPYVLIERQTQLNEPHQLRAGKPVTVFCKEFGLTPEQAKGVVHFAQNNRMQIIFYTSHLPDWLNKKKIGIDLAFDGRSFEEMHKAVRAVLSAEEGRLIVLREMFLGKRVARFRELDDVFFNPQLNRSQNRAVNQILAARDIAVVHGPPGTGKTTTLVQAVKAMCEQSDAEKSPILVCAPSNPAVDLLTERLAAQGLKVVRIGNISRIDEELIRHTIEAHLSHLPEYEYLNNVKREVHQMRRVANKITGLQHYTQRLKRRTLLDEAQNLASQVTMLEDFLINRLISSADAICCTLVGTNNKYLEHRNFDTLIIDEAAQALEPATWIPILKAKRVVLAGDPCQLPPTIVSEKARKQGLAITLIEKCLKRLSEISLLNIQYRMNEVIMGFSNQQFYNNALKADASVAQLFLHTTEGISQPLEFIDTAGCGYSDQLNPQSKSYFNPNEYAILGQRLDILLSKCPKNPRPSVAIISPYKEQVTYITEELQTHEQIFDASHITIDTIDAFQGQERDIVYISLVRSNKNHKIGFLRDFRRMNVAMTRAKKKLVVIGDSETLGKTPFYQNFVMYCKKMDGYTKLSNE